jgi:hypothetical protein
MPVEPTRPTVGQLAAYLYPFYTDSTQTLLTIQIKGQPTQMNASVREGHVVASNTFCGCENLSFYQ